MLGGLLNSRRYQQIVDDDVVVVVVVEIKLYNESEYGKLTSHSDEEEEEEEEEEEGEEERGIWVNLSLKFRCSETDNEDLTIAGETMHLT